MRRITNHLDIQHEENLARQRIKAITGSWHQQDITVFSNNSITSNLSLLMNGGSETTITHSSGVSNNVASERASSFPCAEGFHTEQPDFDRRPVDCRLHPHSQPLSTHHRMETFSNLEKAQNLQAHTQRTKQLTLHLDTP